MCGGGWGGNITLVLIAGLSSLSLEHQPSLRGSSGHHPEPRLAFWPMYRPQRPS